ncbi:hypothetical protein [Agromyces sp. NPDC058064]|uniref:hypothetical protein n=1 Tax=Agromyces sp. NPDC058064 TaxID=3346322 RepID=UPI0036D8A7E5
MAHRIARAFIDQLRAEIESSTYGSIKRFATDTGRSYGSFRRYFLDEGDPDVRDPQLTIVWLAVADLGVSQEDFLKRAMARVQH